MDHLFGKTMKCNLLYQFNLATKKNERKMKEMKKIWDRLLFKIGFHFCFGVSESGIFLTFTLNIVKNIVHIVLYCRFSWVLFLLSCYGVSRLKPVGCVISCFATAHINCSSCFSLTFSVVFVQTCLWDFTKHQFPFSLCDANDGKSRLLSLYEGKCCHLFYYSCHSCRYSSGCRVNKWPVS